MRIMNSKKDIERFIREYKTQYPEGFTDKERNEVLRHFPHIDMKKYNDAMMCLTCKMIGDDTVVYHHDVINAILCGIERRDLTTIEWD